MESYYVRKCGTGEEADQQAISMGLMSALKSSEPGEKIGIMTRHQDLLGLLKGVLQRPTFSELVRKKKTFLHGRTLLFLTHAKKRNLKKCSVVFSLMNLSHDIHDFKPYLGRVRAFIVVADNEVSIEQWKTQTKPIEI